jgi:biopolymer transport protein ExbB
MGEFINFLNAGGIFMWVILAVSILAMAIIVERFCVLHFSYNYDEYYFSHVLRAMRKGQFQEFRKLCNGTVHPLARILDSVVRHKGHSSDAMESAASLSLDKITPKLQKRTGLLQMFGNVATLFGLLGTIQGLVMSFSSLANASAAEKSELLASGISTAMNTTAFGLVVAIPCIVAYTLLSNKEEGILQKYEETIDEVIHMINFSQESASQLSRNAETEKVGIPYRQPIAQG